MAFSPPGSFLCRALCVYFPTYIFPGLLTSLFIKKTQAPPSPQYFCLRGRRLFWIPVRFSFPGVFYPMSSPQRRADAESLPSREWAIHPYMNPPSIQKSICRYSQPACLHSCTVCLIPLCLHCIRIVSELYFCIPVISPGLFAASHGKRLLIQPDPGPDNRLPARQRNLDLRKPAVPVEPQEPLFPPL